MSHTNLGPPSPIYSPEGPFDLKLETLRVGGLPFGVSKNNKVHTRRLVIVVVVDRYTLFTF